MNLDTKYLKIHKSIKMNLYILKMILKNYKMWWKELKPKDNISEIKLWVSGNLILSIKMNSMIIILKVSKQNKVFIYKKMINLKKIMNQ